MTHYKDFAGPDLAWLNWKGDGEAIEIVSIQTFGLPGQVRLGYQARKTGPEPEPAPRACSTCGRPFD
ncbi:MAG TPA: hypothetical protein VF439_03345 [Candidatus Paceibacterota bacterium]